MQLLQSVDRETWCAEGHASTGTGVHHPVWQDHDCAECHLDIDNPTVRTLFAALHPQSSTVQRVPTIVNLNFLPDMGRMNA
jgi:hypothetical protein